MEDGVIRRIGHVGFWQRYGGALRITAYVLAGDPWWVEESVLAYYPMVDRIVVSYDKSGRSWSGEPLPVDEALAHLRSIDVDGKCVFAPGDYSRPGEFALDTETAQRQAVLDQASEGADWVLQLDTDEVIGDRSTFLSCLAETEAAGMHGLEYPARYLYTRLRRGFFLEHCTRMWGIEGNYPGPVAVRAGTTLAHIRQAHVPLFRVDFKAHNTDPAHPRDAIVHRIVPLSSGIRHYSWVRSVEYMHRKAGWSGHADTYTRNFQSWIWRSRHPLMAVACSPVRGANRRFRFVWLPPEQRHWRGEL